MDNELWTISRMLQWTEQYFRSKGIESSRLDGEVLLSHSLGCDRMYLYVNFDRPLDKAELDAYRPLVIQRAKGYSVAAITGHKEFMGLDFHVNEHVLIPRPDTETLIEDILALYDVDASPRILDLCTGPGTILLSLLHYLPNATGVGIDISNKALVVAEENRISLELVDVSRFCESDIKQLLEQVKVGKGTEYGAVLDACKSLLGEQQTALEGMFDVLVSNPPYITTAEMNTLSQEVLHEPHIALHGGDSGLEFYIPIICEGWRLVRDGGYLAIEIGQGQEEAVSKLAAETGCYGEPVYQQDIAGIIREVRWKIQRK
ncbi:peptide chain release factor N(5)-glutamine methyltransferase [Veillonella sp. VA142]|uniref:peptide chain release factor N(5)-glutamine methyltransferase n=1 Tax=Veillonella sp. VA142 TaxID=741834 RepID=UPI000F8CCE70|nr:peptide chain release factor N(5)-glutamine methyltransferase [Veillonella sp. VA142]